MDLEVPVNFSRMLDECERKSRMLEYFIQGFRVYIFRGPVMVLMEIGVIKRYLYKLRSTIDLRCALSVLDFLELNLFIDLTRRIVFRGTRFSVCTSRRAWIDSGGGALNGFCGMCVRPVRITTTTTTKTR